MTHRFYLFISILVFGLLLAACSPAAGTIAPTSVPETAVPSTAVPPTDEPVATDQPADPTPTDEIVPTAEPEGMPEETAVLCPDFPRPAMVLFVGEDYALFNPETGESCTLEFSEDVIGGQLAAVEDGFFVVSRTTGPEGDATVIQKISLDGTVETLPYTMVDTNAGTTLTHFIVSDDGKLIAWNVLGPTGGSDFPGSSLMIANLETGQVLGGTALELEAPRAMQPIRFSDDGSTLFYAVQPYGIGGSWIAFVGRYDNLYSFQTDSSQAAELIFDCAGTGTGICIGDFSLSENSITSLAYVDRNKNSVIVQNEAGTILNTFTSEEEYIGYPMFGPGGDFIYYTADLSDNPDFPIGPENGSLHRAAPINATAETLVSDPSVLLPNRFYNDSQIAVQWLVDGEVWGLALVGLDGSVHQLDFPINASLITIASK